MLTEPTGPSSHWSRSTPKLTIEEVRMNRYIDDVRDQSPSLDWDEIERRIDRKSDSEEPRGSKRPILVRVGILVLTLAIVGGSLFALSGLNDDRLPPGAGGVVVRIDAPAPPSIPTATLTVRGHMFNMGIEPADSHWTYPSGTVFAFPLTEVTLPLSSGSSFSISSDASQFSASVVGNDGKGKQSLRSDGSGRFQLPMTPGGYTLTVIAIWASDRVVAFSAGITVVAPDPSGPSPGTVLSDVPLNGTSSVIASLDGAAWVGTTKTFVRIDAGFPPVALSMRQAPDALVAVPGNGIWIGGFEPGTGAYVARISGSEVSPDIVVPLPPDTSVALLAASPTAVWALVQSTKVQETGTLYRIDPATGAIKDRFPLSDVQVINPQAVPYVYDMSADDSSVYLTVADWLRGQGRTTNYRIVRIDAASGAAVATFAAPTTQLVAAYGSVWTEDDQGAIRLSADLSNPQHLALPTQTYPFGYGSGRVWYVETSNRNTRIVAVNAADNQLVTDISVPSQTGWGSVQASYDGAGNVWLLYENGHVQEIAVEAAPTASSTDVGTLSGHLFAVGGPPGVKRRPLIGSVTITGDGTSKTVAVGAGGSYSISLPPGRYELSGTSPQYNNGRLTCFATAAVDVQTGTNVVSDVYCQEI